LNSRSASPSLPSSIFSCANSIQVLPNPSQATPSFPAPFFYFCFAIHQGG
jgi:hypothetical protein